MTRPVGRDFISAKDKLYTCATRRIGSNIIASSFIRVLCDPKFLLLPVFSSEYIWAARIIILFLGDELLVQHADSAAHPNRHRSSFPSF